MTLRTLAVGLAMVLACRGEERSLPVSQLSPDSLRVISSDSLRMLIEAAERSNALRAGLDSLYGTQLVDDPLEAWARGLPVRRYRVPGEQGYEFDLGDMYRTGEGVPENDAEAVRWYRAAAAQDHMGAQFKLGLMYTNGEGVPGNDAEAVRWYRAAAEQGHAGAQFALGLMYTNGYGVAEDHVQAYAWFNLAAAQGLEEGQGHKDVLSKQMTNAQIAQAQELSLELFGRMSPEG